MGKRLLFATSLAGVAELADAGDSKSPAFGCVGSSPTSGTSIGPNDLQKSLGLFFCLGIKRVHNYEDA